MRLDRMAAWFWRLPRRHRFWLGLLIFADVALLVRVLLDLMWGALR